MGLIQYYALPDMGTSHFSWLLLPFVADMMQHNILFTWASTFLAQCYRELLFYSQGYNTSLIVTIILQVWAYEHIVNACPHEIFIPHFVDNAQYPIGILIWREDFYIHPTDGVRRNIQFYCRVLS